MIMNGWTLMLIWGMSGAISMLLLFPLAYKVSKPFRSCIDDTVDTMGGAVLSGLFPPLLILTLLLCAIVPAATNLYTKWFDLVGRPTKDD